MAPIPKRSEDRIRRNLPDGVDISKVRMDGPVVVPTLSMEDAHPLVEELFSSLAQSGQARHYEPSDWITAKIAMQVLDDLLKHKNQGRTSAQLLAEFNAMMARLMVTEADRRRARVEVTRTVNQKGSTDDGNLVDFATAFERRMQEALG